MSRNILPEPPAELKRLSHSLSDRIRAEISVDGMIPFSRYMEMALYEPGLGYYSAGLHKLGESGDFITAPELGSLFAACLASQVAEVTEMLGAYDILEIGAGTGRMAADLLRELDPARMPERYFILERSADLRLVQHETISETVPDCIDRIEWLDRPPQDEWQGVLIANEVLDALAVERFRIGMQNVEQACVEDQGEGFGWSFREAPTDLDQSVRQLMEDVGSDFARGYCSEINLHLAAWLDAMTRHMVRGLVLFIDYGYPRREYFLPERRDGTLMCHYRHRAHDDVFFWPGLQDITAWVDYTALAEAADACGLDVEGYTSQAMFLLGCGLDGILARQRRSSKDGGAMLADQARQLLLPGMMGERFQAMGLGRGIGVPLQGFSQRDLRHRL
jgi:SAM-dependent MidA family methyltransferase